MAGNRLSAPEEVIARRKRGCVCGQVLLATGSPSKSCSVLANGADPLIDPAQRGISPGPSVCSCGSLHATRQPGEVREGKTFIVASSSPIVSGIAGRYASALFELATEANQIDDVSNALDGFTALLDSSADLDRLVLSPVFTADEQVAAIGAVLKKAEIGGLAANFLQLVAAKRRLFALRSIISGYRALVADAKGIVPAEVTVAAPLSDKNRQAVIEALEARAGKTISLTEKVDPAIIGGLVVKMGSKMIDASLKTKLNAMKLAMNNG